MTIEYPQHFSALFIFLLRGGGGGLVEDWRPFGGYLFLIDDLSRSMRDRGLASMENHYVVERKPGVRTDRAEFERERRGLGRSRHAAERKDE